MDADHSIIKDLNIMQGPGCTAGGQPQPLANEKLYARGRVIDYIESLEKKIKKLEKAQLKKE